MIDSKRIFFFFISLTAFLSQSCGIEGESESSNIRILENLDSYVIAHACNWTQFNDPINSRAAFEASLQLKIFGVEFDVNQTADGIFVVYHNSEINNRNIRTLNYSELSDVRLSNGEKIPTLEEFMTIYKSSDSMIKLIIELKTGNPNLLIKKISDYGLLDRVLFVSFSQDYCNELVKAGFEHKVIYNASNESEALSPLEIRQKGYWGFSYHYALLEAHENWIEEASQNGVRACAWVIDDPTKVEAYVNRKIIVTTNYPWIFSSL